MRPPSWPAHRRPPRPARSSPAPTRRRPPVAGCCRSGWPGHRNPWPGHRNRWPGAVGTPGRVTGIRGRVPSERLAGSGRNGWPGAVGIRNPRLARRGGDRHHELVHRSTPAGRRRRRPSTSAYPPAGTRSPMGATSRNPYPSRGGAAAPGRRAGDHGGRGGPRWTVDAADGRHAEHAAARPRGTGGRSRPAPDRTACTRRRAACRCRSGPPGSCPARIPEQARREFVHEARGVRDRSSIGLLPSPGRPWISPRAFTFSACCMGAIPTAAPRAGELSGRTDSPSSSRRERQKSAGRGGHQHGEGIMPPEVPQALLSNLGCEEREIHV